jgi:hypothetical protein
LAQEAENDPSIRCLAGPLTTARQSSSAALRAIDLAPISRNGQRARGLNG